MKRVSRRGWLAVAVNLAITLALLGGIMVSYRGAEATTGTSGGHTNTKYEVTGVYNGDGTWSYTVTQSWKLGDSFNNISHLTIGICLGPNDGITWSPFPNAVGQDPSTGFPASGSGLTGYKWEDGNLVRTYTLTALGYENDPSGAEAVVKAGSKHEHFAPLPGPDCTPEEPTETPVPPTETPVPPTETPIPPTETPIPPTETPVEEQAASLTVFKEVINDDGGNLGPEDFTAILEKWDGDEWVEVDSQPFAAVDEDSGSVTFTDLEPGLYRVREEPPSGYLETIGTGEGDDCDVETGEIDLEDGDEAQCTITNDDEVVQEQAASLTVFKEVVNDNGGTLGPEAFTALLQVWNGSFWETVQSQPFAAVDEDSGSVTFTDLEPGDYRVWESPPTGYKRTVGGEEGDDCTAGTGEITLAQGDEAQCTITNNDIPGTLRIVKHVINDDGGTAGPDDFEFIIEKDGVEIDRVSPGENGEIDVELDPGTYTVIEVDEEGYTLVDAWCVEGKTEDDAEPSSVQVYGDYTSVCEFTNDDEEPTPTPTETPVEEQDDATLTVHKVVTNDDGGTKGADDFTVVVYRLVNGEKGEKVAEGTFDAETKSVTFVLEPGSYLLEETQESLGDYIASFDPPCDEGEVVLEEGEVAECTVENDDPTVQVEEPTPTPIDEVEGVSKGPKELPKTGGEPVRYPWALLVAFGASLVSLGIVVRRYFLAR